MTHPPVDFDTWGKVFDALQWSGAEHTRATEHLTEVRESKPWSSGPYFILCCLEPTCRYYVPPHATGGVVTRPSDPPDVP